MKVAIIHDYLNQYGGAERVLEALCQLYPTAPIYTSIHQPSLVRHHFDDRQVHTSFMQYFPGIMKHHQLYFMVYPYAFESFDLSEYDLVISSSSAYAKGVVTGPNTLHICYCHTPARFLWQYEDYARREKLNTGTRRLLPFFLNHVRLWDVISAQRPDYYVANSQTVARRIEDFWQREAVVINPPVEIADFEYLPGPRQAFYLWVGRLIPYKRVDVAIQAFKELDLPLKVVGTGRDMAALKKLAGPRTEFLGHVSDSEVRTLMNQCRAFIQVGADDFGITPVEAMAGGAPVIAINANGPAEVVVDGQTGLFFEEQTPASLIEAVRRFEQQWQHFDNNAIRRYSHNFDRELFCQRFGDFVTKCWEEFSSKQAPGIKYNPNPVKEFS